MFQVNQKRITDEFIDKHNSTYSVSLMETKSTIFNKVFIVSTFNQRKGTLIITDREIQMNYDLAVISSDPKTRCTTNDFDFFTYRLQPY